MIINFFDGNLCFFGQFSQKNVKITENAKKKENFNA